jgi:hypothetical protein
MDTEAFVKQQYAKKRAEGLVVEVTFDHDVPRSGMKAGTWEVAVAHEASRDELMARVRRLGGTAAVAE